MKSGDYMIHVYVQSGRNFITDEFTQEQPESKKKGQKPSLFNAMVCVSTCESTQYSSVPYLDKLTWFANLSIVELVWFSEHACVLCIGSQFPPQSPPS